MKRVLSVLFVLFGVSCLMGAQTRISGENMEVRDDSVTVSFKVDADTGIPSKYKEVIVPYIHNGDDTLYLDVMEVYGRERYMRQRQEAYIAGDRDWELGKGQVLAGMVYEYVASVPLKRWMTSATLGVQRHFSGCNCEKNHSDETLGESESLFEMPALPPRRIPGYVLVDASRTWDFGQDELEIIFKVSKIEIDSSVFNNEVTFGKILEAVDKIHSDSHYRIDRIEVAGYASPEGRPAFNRWLGENRAKALIDYIISHRPEYGLTADDFRIRNGEENWPGLRRLVAASELENKDRVLAIIDDETIPSELKKDKIKWIDRRQTWKKMLDDIYPHLRCARYLAVWYDSTDDNAVDVINHANELIREGRYAEARDYIRPVEDDMLAYNTIGVIYMLQGDFEEALPWFEKALEGNCPSAQHNIDAINAELEYEAVQREEMEKYLNRYN